MPEVIAGVYEITDKIGAGGAGVVYLGRHLRLGKKIVLKADKRTLATKPEVLRREVDALKVLSHTYIPQVYDFVAEGGTVYTVMDYIEGESLDKPLKRGERFSQAQVIDWACQLLEALCYLHSRPPYGILHGDIKPANIMVTPQNDIRLIDFNIALALGEEGTVRAGYSRGYASPEHYGLDYTIHPNAPIDTQASGYATEIVSDSQKPTDSTGSTSRKRGGLLDVRSDIYSLGATLYHLLTGIRPNQDAKEVTAIADRNVSPAVAAIIAKAMRPNPDERYQSAAEMLAAFENLHHDDPRSRRLRRTTAFTIAALFTLFLAGAFLTFTGQRQIAAIERNQARVERSIRALRAGDVSSAVNLAAEALTLKRGLFDPPNSAEAQKALTDALGVYDLESGFEAYQTFNLPSEPLKVLLSPNGSRLAAIYAWQMAVYDLDTLERLAVLNVEESALSDMVFLDENRVVYAGEGAVRAYDLAEQRELWSGEAGTKIVRSADGRRIASVYKDEQIARVYDAENGEVLKTVSFEGKHQWVAANDRYADPGDNLLALNTDGSLLAASFEDGSLTIFYLEDEEGGNLEVLDSTDFFHFEGGFYNRYFAFSAYTGAEGGYAVFEVIDTVNLRQTVLFDLAGPAGVQSDERGILLSYYNSLLRIDPETGAQTEVAYTEKDIAAFHCDSDYVITSEQVDERGSRFSFFDRGAGLMEQTEMDGSCDFVALSGKYALAASRNTPTLRLLRLEDHADARVFSYDPAYVHDEARLSADGETVMLFRYDTFRIYNIDGSLITQEAIPDAREVYDQQYRRDGDASWLEVTYNDGFIRDYSAQDASVLDERQGEAPDLTLYEEFLTDHLRITRTLHDAPVAYDRESGKLIRELEQDDTLAYVDQAGDYVITWYLTAQGDWYGLLLDGSCQTLARLPHLCDVIGERVIFDYSSGELKGSPIYSLEELLSLAETYA